LEIFQISRCIRSRRPRKDSSSNLVSTLHHQLWVRNYGQTYGRAWRKVQVPWLKNQQMIKMTA